MKLATALVDGREMFGAIEGDLFHPIDAGDTDLLAILAAGSDTLRPVPSSQGIALSDVTFLPPINRADARIYALGWAYLSHQLETKKDAPEFPVLFDKQPQAFVGHGQSLIKPRASNAYDFEGEIALVIGKGGRDIAKADALSHIAGYTIVMDGSARDFQKHSITAGKNFDKSSAMGPWIVTADEVPDPAQLVITTRLNGVQMQHSGFDLMAWDLGYLINYISTIFTLKTGDVISTGTPAGVGNRRDPQLFMKVGDVLEVEVDGIGLLRNTVAAQS